MPVLDLFRLDGRTALITGGSRGLGLSMAHALAEAGANLILVARDEATLATARDQLTTIGRRVDIIPGNISTPAGATAVCDAALALGLPIDILINNVGGRRLDVAVEDMPLDDWQRMIDLNLTSALVVSKQIGGPMRARRHGVIINVTSIAGPIIMKGIRGRHYETAKAALAALTRSLAADWADHGVRVNAIAPGVFATDPNKRWFDLKPEFKQTFLDHIPMNRLGNPEEIGPVAVFLASDASSYITGATVVVDGGFTLW